MAGSVQETPVNIVIVAHGDMGVELVRSLHMIMGAAPGVYAVSLSPEESIEDLGQAVKSTITKGLAAYDGAYTLMLVDMFGGSCANVAAKVAADLDPERIIVVAGVNLPMVVDAVINRDILDFPDLVRKVVEAGNRSIIDMSDLVRGITRKNKR
jgi:mannose/fructose/sorbose-specific phosphotransferase system IIA component